MAAATGCIFCGSMSNKMSREHLFHRSWADRILHAPSMTRHDHDLTTGTSREIQMRTSLFEQQVNGVCRTCNSTWMNGMDTAVESVVIRLARAEDTQITASEITSFAAWATKVALMRSWVNKGSNGHADPELFRSFYEQQLPTARTRVRVGMSTNLLKQGGSNGYSRATTVPADQLDIVLSAGDDYETLRSGSINVVSWGMGALFVHVILVSAGAPVAVGNAVDKAVRTIAGGSLRRIWPADRRTVRFVTPVTEGVAARIGNLSHLVSGAPLLPTD